MFSFAGGRGSREEKQIAENMSFSWHLGELPPLASCRALSRAGKDTGSSTPVEAQLQIHSWGPANLVTPPAVGIKSGEKRITLRALFCARR